MTGNNSLQALLTTEEYCQILGISVSKARQDRVKGKGCPWRKIGRVVRYDPSDVRAFLDKNVRVNTIMPQTKTKAAR